MIDRDKDRYQVFSRRAFLIGAAKIGLLGLLGTRLGYLQVTEGEKYKTLAERNRVNFYLTAPSRGRIFDHKGKLLADNIQNFRVNIVPEQAKDREATLYNLSKIIPLEKHEIDRTLSDMRKVRSFVPVTVKENLTWDQVSKIEVNLPRLSGLAIEEGEIRQYPYKTSTAHLIGYVGLVNQADLKREKTPALTIPGFRLGKTGIEKKMDKTLRGKAGSVKVEVNAAGRIVRELDQDYALPGSNITLSIDADYQNYVQDVLKKEKSASAVVMNANDGRIYALCSSPGFDPNLFTTRISARDWEKLLNDPTVPLTNKAIAGQYPPGSTFKMVTALAALEAGIVDKDTTYHCPGYLDVNTHRFHCWKRGGHGKMNLTEALSQSCDVYFYEIARELGIKRLAAMARKLGLGQILPLDIANVRPGLVPTKEWKMATFGKGWGNGETILASIGQGYMQATPLQLATMTARLVNGGKAVSPSLILKENDAPFIRGPHENWEKLDVQQKHLDIIKFGMDRVVNHPKGTAKDHKIDNSARAYGGKTGTAQVRRISKQDRLDGIDESKRPWRLRHHALFVGYAPLTDPKYICSIVVEHGGSGSSSAAPIAKKLIDKIQRLGL